MVIEYNLRMIKVADHLIDLEPQGETWDGEIVCIGIPEKCGSLSAQQLSVPENLLS